MVFSPAVGVKQTVSLDSVPPMTVTDWMLPSGSAYVNPGRQICERSQTNRAVSPGAEAAGGELSVMATLVLHVSAAPAESVAIKVMV